MAAIITTLGTLADGEGLDVAEVDLGGVKYTVYYLKAGTDATTKINTDTHTITVTKGTMPADSGALIADLKTIKIGGDKAVPTLDGGGDKIVCSANFDAVTAASAASCLAITLPASVLKRMQELSNNEQVEIVKIKINGEDYVGNFKVDDTVVSTNMADNISIANKIRKGVLHQIDSSIET